MKQSILAAACVCAGLAWHGLAAAATFEVADAFETSAVDAATAYDFVKACAPSVSEASFNRMIRDAGDKSTVLSRPADKTRPYLAISAGKAFCVRMSERKYPILPLSAFDDTINFESMPSPEMRRLRTDLSTQLATNGFATALVVNDRGNASQVVYLMTSEMPSKVYYHANFLRKEDMTEAVGAAAYHAPGNMSLTSRGQPAESVKYLFAK